MNYLVYQLQAWKPDILKDADHLIIFTEGRMKLWKVTSLKKLSVLRKNKLNKSPQYDAVVKVVFQKHQVR